MGNTTPHSCLQGHRTIPVETEKTSTCQETIILADIAAVKNHPTSTVGS